MRARFLATCFFAADFIALSTIAADRNAETDRIEFKGRVVAIPGTTNLQFRVESGAIYKLLPSRDAQAIFADTNLHSKILVVKGRIHSKQPKDSALEVIGNLHELKKGKRYELYYYCDICSVETSFPGPCVCCREDVVLHERPARR
jgi:hypothetical protein